MVSPHFLKTTRLAFVAGPGILGYIYIDTAIYACHACYACTRTKHYVFYAYLKSRF